MRDRHDLSDAQWALLEPLQPDRTPRRGGRWHDRRRAIDGVLWRTLTRAPWRDILTEYGTWQTLYDRHQPWSEDGTWSRVLDRLRAASDTHTQDGEWAVSIDSTIVRAHQDAASARHTPPKTPTRAP